MSSPPESPPSIAEVGRWLGQFSHDLIGLFQELERLSGQVGLHPLYERMWIPGRSGVTLANASTWFPTKFGRGYAPLSKRKSAEKVHEAYFHEVWLCPPFDYPDACLVSVRVQLQEPQQRRVIWDAWRSWFGQLIAESDVDPGEPSFVLPPDRLADFQSHAKSAVAQVVLLTDLVHEGSIQRRILDPLLAPVTP